MNTRPSQRQMALVSVYSVMDSGTGTRRLSLIPKSPLICSFTGAYEGNYVERIIASAADREFQSAQPLGYQVPGKHVNRNLLMRQPCKGSSIKSGWFIGY